LIIYILLFFLMTCITCGKLGFGQPQTDYRGGFSHLHIGPRGGWPPSLAQMSHLLFFLVILFIL
jgi:hypothetical protein